MSRVTTRRWIGGAAVVVSIAIALALNLPGAAADRSGVSATSTGPRGERPCSRFELRAKTVVGGCKVFTSAVFDLTVLNLFGDRLFGRCVLLFDLAVGPDGEAALTNVLLTSSTDAAASTCGDVARCRFDGPMRPTWTGRFVSDRGRLHLDVDRMCFDTCLGRFEGATRLALRRNRSGALALRADRSALGTSGLAISGTWDLGANPDRGALGVTATGEPD